MATPDALAIAEAISDCEIAATTVHHRAMRQAQIATEARLIDRVAAVAGVSVSDIAARLHSGAAGASGVLAGRRDEDLTT